MLTITLPPELEEAVTKRASECGITPERLAVDDLRRVYLGTRADTESEGQTLLDYWADYIGAVDSRENGREASNLSEDTGRKFTELMVEKHRQGKL